jgi:hypothetical protein
MPASGTSLRSDVNQHGPDAFRSYIKTVISCIFSSHSPHMEHSGNIIQSFSPMADRQTERNDAMTTSEPAWIAPAK